MRWVCLLFCIGVGVGTAFAESVVFESGEASPRFIELYTSQGCSSCPPAERWLENYVDSPDLWKEVIPLAFHVDYWDRLGWKDPFATRENTERQYRLKEEGGVNSIYTPGFVVDGKEWRGWFKGESLPSPVSSRPGGKLRVEIESGSLKADYSGKADGRVLHIAILGFGLKTAILRGENRGRSMDQSFVVLNHVKSSIRSGRIERSLPTVGPGTAERYGIAIWVASDDDSQPLEALGGWIPKEEAEGLQSMGTVNPN